MGIKDNFSQAVKELWKKDGLEETGEKTDKPAQPTELDRYLNAPQEQFQQEQAQPQQMMGQTAQQSAQPVQPANPSQPMQSAQQAQNVQQSAQAPQQGQNTQGYQFSQQADAGAAGAPLETSYYRDQNAQNNMGAQNSSEYANPQMAQGMQNAQGVPNYGAANNQVRRFGGGNGYVPPVPPTAPGQSIDAPSDTDEVTVISRNTIIDGNVRSLANMQVDGNIKGNIETTRDIEMSGKVVGDIKCNNANMNSAAMQGNLNLKGKVRMDRRHNTYRRPQLPVCRR